MADSREPGHASWIARERLGPTAAGRGWWLALLAITAIGTAGLVAMAIQIDGRTTAEETYRASDGFLQALQSWMDPVTARSWSIAAGAIMIAATGYAARRLLHHDLAALLAAALVALDPMHLVHGSLATPVAPAAAGAMLGLALFLAPAPRAAWWGSAALAGAAFLEPTYLLWSPAIVVLLLVRGHIYAAPQHLLSVGVQAALVPAIGAALGALGASSLRDGCYQHRGDLLLRSTVDLGTIPAVPNPVTWFAGLGVLLYLIMIALTRVLREFRIQRLPGRIQVRLAEPLRRIDGRALWIGALLLFAPTQSLWLPILAIGLAAGIQELGRDARAFGTVVGLIVLAFVVMFTAQALSLGVGEAAVPWTALAPC